MTIAANWGASLEERALAMPCDRLLAEAPVRLERAISVHASAAVVFRRLCQLKLAPYSYDLIDNFGRRSPRDLVPGVEQLELGQRFMSIFSLASFVQDEHITLRSGRVAVTYALRSCSRGPETRLIARVLFDAPGGPLASALLGNALALGDLVMMRKQLLTLRDLAERDGASERRLPGG